MNYPSLLIRDLNLSPYLEVWDAMRQFTQQRTSNSNDEIWLVEHPPLYTLGQNAKLEHIRETLNIPMLKVDRGGQVTYHGPGQLMAYVLLDLTRYQLNIRKLISLLEGAVIDLLADYNITALARCDAPGVYVQGSKICSIGLRIRRNCSYHGLALNVAMDLQPFTKIDPCGYRDLMMSDLKTFVKEVDMFKVKQQLIIYLLKRLEGAHGFTDYKIC